MYSYKANWAYYKANYATYKQLTVLLSKIYKKFKRHTLLQ